MRVIAGIYRSRVLVAPEGLNTRPTMDKVKESMFNIIGPSINDAVCVDLFSGSGGLGIEAISRGAKKVYFNDHNNKSLGCINKNIDTLKINKDVAIVSNMDYKKRIETLDEKIDVLFLDPPYREKIYIDIINLFIERDLFSVYTIVVCECDLAQEYFEIDGFSSKEYLYGNKKLIVLKSI